MKYFPSKISKNMVTENYSKFIENNKNFGANGL